MNHRNPAIRRILADVRELKLHTSSRYYAEPLEEDMFEWHFTIRGPEDTPFAGGIYHGRILLPAEYPMKPPNIVFMTRNGRFEVGTKICLSISAYHEETWQPAWGIRTMLEALISFFPTEGAGAIGALDWSAAERKKLAVESQKYCCPVCGEVAKLLSEPEADEKLDPTIAKEIAQIRMSKPTSNSGKFNTSGAINDVGTHTDLEVEQVQLIPDNCLQTDCMDKLEQDLADLAESHLDADPDADGSVQDMLDVNTVNKKSPSFTSNNESPTKKAEGESVNVSSPVKVVPGSPVRAVPAAAEPVAEPVIQEGLRQRHPPHEHRHVAPVAPVAARPVQAAVARRPELFDVILDGLITLTIAALIYVGSGIAMKLA